MLGSDEPTWLVRLFPFLDRKTESELWDLYTPFGSHPPEARQQIVSTFLCPSRHTMSHAIAADDVTQIDFACGCASARQNVPGGAVTDYGGNMGDTSPGASGGPTDFYWGGRGTGVLIASRPVPAKARDELTDLERFTREFSPGKPMTPANIWQGWSDKIRLSDIDDGSSNTLLVGEMHIPPESLNKSPFNGAAYLGRHFSHFSRIVGPGVPFAHHASDDRASVYSFGGPHSGGVQFCLADGSVRLISTSISTRTAARLANRADQQSVGSF